MGVIVRREVARVDSTIANCRLVGGSCGAELSANQSIKKRSIGMPYYVGATFIVVLITLFAGLILWQEAKQRQQQSQMMMQNATTLLSHHIEGIFNEADTLLQAVSFHYRDQLLMEKFNPKRFNDYLQLALSWAPEFSNLGFLDAKGIYRFGIDQAQPIDLSEREYFTLLRDKPSGSAANGMIFSGPIFTKLSQRWALVLARRVDHPDGSFAGVLFVRWDIDRLTTLLESIHIGQKGTIELRTSDMVQVSRYPSIDHPELGPGNKRVPAHLSRMLQISPEGGSYRAISALDQIERHYTYLKVGEYPFLISAGLQAGYSFENWSVNTKLVLLLSALMILLTVAGARRMYRQSLRRIQQQLNSYAVRILTASPVAMMMLDSNGQITHANPAAKRLFGYPGDLLIGTAVVALHPASSQLSQAQRLKQIDQASELITEAEYVRLDGSPFSALQSLAALPDMDGNVNHYIETVVDITDLKLAQERLKKQAETDKLTGLLNRHSGDHVLTEAARIAENTGTAFSVIMCDIDHFKRVNDVYGHPEGDRVLVNVANILRDAVRAGDRCIRWGGEEFLIVLPGCPLPVATSLAKGLCLLIKESDNEKVGPVTMSFGVAQWVQHESVNELIERVDRALYEAKNSGRNRVVISAC